MDNTPEKMKKAGARENTGKLRAENALNFVELVHNAMQYIGNCH